MLVQLSPWKTVKTSIRCPRSQRRRKRDENGFASKEFPVRTSFVTTSTRKVQQRMRRHSAEFSESMPVLAITSDHLVTVVGRSREPAYQEYGALRYTSRPGNAGAFLSSSTNGKSSSGIPKIPAILDVKNDMVYTMQHGNKRLCCWHSLHASGPDEKTALKVELAQPALSMSLLPLNKGVVYGSCINGNIFVARVVSTSDGEEIFVEYISSKQPKGSEHVGTLAELPQGQAKTTGRKRKMSDADGHSTVVFYQAFCNGKTISLARHELMCERFSADNKLIIEGSLAQQVTAIDLTSGKDKSKNKVGKASLLVSSSGTSPKVALLYDIQTCATQSSNGNMGGSNQYFCASLSLTTGDISHRPVPLPSETQQCGLVTEKLLTVTTKEVISLYDLETGSILHSAKMADIIGISDKWLLCTDAKLATVAILFEKEDHIHAAFSIANLGSGQKSLVPSTRLNLASKVSSYLINSSNQPSTSNGFVSDMANNLLKIGNEGNGNCPTINLEDAVHRALKELEDVCMSDHGTKKSIVLDRFEHCVANLLSDVKSAQTDSDGNVAQHNPQDALPSTDSVKPANGKKSLNQQLFGLKPSEEVQENLQIPSMLPQSFVDGALRIVLPLIQDRKPDGSAPSLAQIDAREILKRLLETNKVSARSLFEGTNSIQESGQDHLLISVLRSVQLSEDSGMRVFSPFDMICEMLRSCSDISERQLVVMLRYMLRESSPDDIAATFMVTESLHAQHPYKKLSRKYNGFRKAHKNATKRGASSDSEKLTRKLILAGTTYVLHQIINYSECNEAMLRVALLEEIVTRDEAIILAKLLSDLLTLTSQDSRFKSSRSNLKVTCQWVAALCDSFQDDLSEAKGSDGNNYLDFLLASVNSAMKQSQAIISLREDISRAHTRKEVTIEEKDNAATPMEVKRLHGGDEIPGYSVDRIVF